MPKDDVARPPLLALLICERIMMEDDKVPTLLRVIDTFNFSIETRGLPVVQGKNVGLLLNCWVFTRWGLGKGEFTEELAVVLPEGREVRRGPSVKLKKPGGFHFSQIRHNVSMVVKEPGIYAFRVYLDGELVGEHPFRVNIERKTVA
ncbi:MAG: hypothetical protein HY685_01440 [Chloroflexi bacterium]|nr:hypothetical protein [Chloroflexota bacterium]